MVSLPSRIKGNSIATVIAVQALLTAKLFVRQQKSKPVAIREWIPKHPGRSIILTSLAGALIGINDEACKMIKQFADRHLGEN